MDLGLKDKIALVGGGSKGLGRAAAMALAQEGAKVVIISRTEDVLGETAETIHRETGAEVTARPADLSLADQARRIVRETIDGYGRLDILVNNAGGPPTGQFLDFGEDDWAAAFRTNLMSAVTMAGEALPSMKEHQWGRIINLTSIAVKQPLDGLILSNAVRAGVHGWAKSLANEVASLNITVNNVLPGYTLTDRVRSLAGQRAEQEGISTEQVIGQWENNIPMKRLGRPEELGSLVAFLASNQAAYITGVSIPIDGGFYKGLM